jgi:hypothetical protein
MLITKLKQRLNEEIRKAGKEMRHHGTDESDESEETTAAMRTGVSEDKS